MRSLWLHSTKHQKICYLFSKIKLWRSVCSFLLHQPIQPYLLSHKIDRSLFSSIVILCLLGFLISQSTLHEHNYSCTFFQITDDFKMGSGWRIIYMFNIVFFHTVLTSLLLLLVYAPILVSFICSFVMRDWYAQSNL